MNQNNCGQSFKQTLVNQQPVYDKKQVMDRRMKVMRPSLRKKKNTVKYL